MTKDNKRRTLQRLLSVLFGCMAGFILIVNLLKSCFPRVLHQYYELETQLSSPLMMIFGILFIFGIYLIFRTIENNKNPIRQKRLSERNTLLLTGTVFFFVQMYLIYNYCFETDWDVQILLDSARNIANGHRPNHNAWYYSCYPNNLFLTTIFAVILWIAKPLHLGSLDFLSIVAVQSLFCVLVSFMLYQIIIHRWHRRDIAWLGMTLYLLIVGLSPWTSIPYSDAWALLFPIAVLWAYNCNILKEKRFLRWFLMVFIAFIGFKIKPQVIFILLSLVAIETVDVLLRWNTTSVRELLKGKGLRGGAAGLASAFIIALVITAATPIAHNSRDRFGAAHFLMMGLNRNTIGDYSDDDVIFARQYSTPHERDKAELKEAGRRLHEMGLAGFGQLACEKTLVNYYDGTFFWGKEGYFYKTVFPERNRHLSPFLRNLYYNRMIHGAYYPYWCTGATIVWLGVLVLMFLTAISRQDRFTAALMISILLLTLYEAFFEARARYLYAYIPFYILLALQGISNIERLITKKRSL